MNSYILCDIDGVLIDTKKTVISSYQQALNLSLNKQYSYSEVEFLVWGLSWEGIKRKLKAAHNTSEEDLLSLRRLKDELFKVSWSTVAKESKDDSLCEALKCFHGHGVGITLVTAGSERLAEWKLQQAGINITDAEPVCGMNKSDEVAWKELVEEYLGLNDGYCITVIDDDLSALHAVKMYNPKILRIHRSIDRC